MRLIDADELKMCIRMLAKDIARAHGGVDDATLALKEAFDMVDEQPTIDAEPVRHGRWIAVPSSDVMTGKAYKCSECNKMRYGSFMPNYCQNCGAKMDAKEEEHATDRCRCAEKSGRR